LKVRGYAKGHSKTRRIVHRRPPAARHHRISVSFAGIAWVHLEHSGRLQIKVQALASPRSAWRENVTVKEMELSYGVHCASFLLCTCTTGMERISPFPPIGNKPPNGPWRRLRRLRWNLFLTPLEGHASSRMNGAISSVFLYMA